MKKTFVLLAMLLVAVVIGMGVREGRVRAAQSGFPGYTAVIFDYVNCDPTLIKCSADAQHDIELFPDGQSKSVGQVLSKGGLPPKVRLETTNYTTDFVPALGAYSSLHRTRPLIANRASLMSSCDPKNGAVQDTSVSSWNGHPAVKYNKPDRSTIYLLDAICFEAMNVSRFTANGGAPAGETYQLTTSITIGTPPLSDLEIPAGSVEDSPLTMYHDYQFLVFKSRGIDPEQGWNNLTAHGQGVNPAIAGMEKLWQIQHAK